MLELVEAAFDEMPFLVEGGIERKLSGPGGVGGDDRLSPGGGNIPAEVVGVIGGVGDHLLGRQAGDQGLGLGDVIALAGGQQEAHRQAQTAHRQVDLARQAPARAAEGLILSPPFAPAACW